MKLRFRTNTLRLRVNQREVEALAGGQALREHVAFPGGNSLWYVLETQNKPEGSASFEEGTICVSAPRNEVDEWASGESVGLYFELSANDSVLKIAIEKDLECVDGPEEERDPHAFSREAIKAC